MADEETPPPKSGEGRAAAAALDALDNARRDDFSGSGAGNADAAALGEAMKNLSVGAGPVAAEETSTKEKKKVVKIESEDVALLVDELEITNAAATKLLRAYDGDIMKTMTAYVRSEA